MQQERENMSLMKKLMRINKAGGSMSPAERAWFEEKSKESDRLGIQAGLSIKKQ
jgi:DNA-binding SARP family transcriptional activator